MKIPDDLKYDAAGLIPAVIQEGTTGKVLMVAYMNAESLRKTVEAGLTWFWSRSRQKYWQKGETSGNIQRVRLLRYQFRLPPGPARWFFCNTISLLPGTAVVAVEGDSLCAHVLDLSPQSAQELRDLEGRIAALFGLAWVEHGETMP